MVPMINGGSQNVCARALVWVIAWSSELPVLATLRLYLVLITAAFAVAIAGTLVVPSFAFGIAGGCAGVGFWLLARSLERGVATAA